MDQVMKAHDLYVKENLGARDDSVGIAVSDTRLEVRQQTALHGSLDSQ